MNVCSLFRAYLRDIYEIVYLFLCHLLDCGIQPLNEHRINAHMLTILNVDVERCIFGETIILQEDQEGASCRQHQHGR